MKRHPALIPFSHDHHDGLVIAQRLLQGGSKAPRSNWPSGSQAQRDRVVEFESSYLRHHLGAEEALLFPLARRFLGPEGARLVDELVREHEALRNGVRQFKDSRPPDLVSQMKDWAQLLHDHIRKEERFLFQAMQQQVPEAQLAALPASLEDYYRQHGRPEGSCLL